MMRSLWAGVTGLQAHQIAMDVEGHNIANVNTTGFKYGRANFNDLMSQTAKVATAPQGELGGKNPMQIGLGTQVSSITKIFKQGSVQTTDKNTDLAIQGDGFFVISPDGGKTYKYTRNGDFVRDARGNFVDNNGYIAQGWLRDEVTGEVDTTAPVKNIVIKPGLTTPANPTSIITLKANLNSGNEIGDKRTPIYTLDSQHEWMDINKDGLKVDAGLHKENDLSKDEFLTTKDRELRLKERGVDMGVLFNRAGESFNLRTGQGIWVSYAQAKTKPIELHGISDTGKFDTAQNLSINLNGVVIKQSVSNISDILAAINAKTNETGVSANIIDGTKLQLVNDNKFGTTAMSKNIKLKEEGALGTDTTGLFGRFLGANEQAPDGFRTQTVGNQTFMYSQNISLHREDPNGPTRDAWNGIEVVTAYQYVYDASPVNTDHSLNDRIERKFHTTEDLREAMQVDARLWVNYDGRQYGDTQWSTNGTINDGVRVEVGEKGQFIVFNPSGDARNETDGDMIDLTSEAINDRIRKLWDAHLTRVNGAQAEAAYIQAKATRDGLQGIRDGAQTALDNATNTLNGRQLALAQANMDETRLNQELTELQLDPVANAAEIIRVQGELAQVQADKQTLEGGGAGSITEAQTAVTGAEGALRTAQQNLDNNLPTFLAAKRAFDDVAGAELDFLHKFGAPLVTPPGAAEPVHEMNFPTAGGNITDTMLRSNWAQLTDAQRNEVIKAFKDQNPWIAQPHNIDTAADDYHMFMNVSNLSNPEKGINENDKFMKTMQGIQGALALGDYSRETQGLYLSAHSSSLDVYDSLGTKHSVKFDFTKVGYTDDGGTEWNMVIQVPEPCEINLNGDGPKNVITGSIRFNSDGSLQGFNPTSISFTANNGSTPNQNIDLNFGNTNDFDGLTSYDRESNTSGISQDGFSGGDLNGIRVDESGTIIGSFTNGRSFGLAQIAMATFTNNEGLEADGGNVFSQTSNSGEPVIGAATTGGRGKVQASSLEMSNVDLSRSLTQLIVIQRGYQANSKTITTSDQMLNTLLQLKQ